MRAADVEAARTGRATGAVALGAVAVGAVLGLAAASGVRSARIPLAACAAVVATAWSIAYVAMMRHQRRTGLPAADCEAWQRRMWRVEARMLALVGGALVPWFYLLENPAHRRIAARERRASRRGRRR